MLLASPIKISYRNLLAAKFRSFLTILGIIIGVGSVILIMAIGQSAQHLILSQISGIGSNLIGVLPGASDGNGPPAAAMGVTIKTLKYDDLVALRNGHNVPEIAAGAGYVNGTDTVSYEGEEMTVSFVGTTASYIDVENTEVANGRFFTEEEEANMSRSVVIGIELAQDLFGNEDPLEKSIKLKDQRFTVVGVLKKRGSSGFGMNSQDDSIYVPLKTAQKILLGIDYVAYMRLKVSDPEFINVAKDEVATTLRERHNIDDPSKDDFTVDDQAKALEMITNITNVLKYFLMAIGTISLVVGGVGIMNIMLIAVNQRIREVGLRKAVGAKNWDVQVQFVIESIFISFLGGAIGIMLGILIAALISVVARFIGYDWPLLISWQSIAIATFVSIGIGIVFGLYPARKASKISPMEALRYE